MKKTFIFILILSFITLIFINNNIVLLSTIDGIKIWLYKVFPYLFIMVIINDCLINLNIIKIFKNPSIYVFIMSLISGTPSSAYIVGNLYKNKTINKNTANSILLFTYFGNPLFLYTMLNNIFLNKYIAIKIIIIHYLSNFIIYLFNIKQLDNNISNCSNYNINIAESIKKAINTNLVVLGTICFYLVISNIIITILPTNPYIRLFIRGFLEVTQGLNALISFKTPYSQLLATIILSFGGLSIHTQVKCILDEYELDYNYFLKGRIIQTILATIIILIYS